LTSTAGDAIAGSYKTVDDGRPSVVLVEELIGLVVFSFVSAGTPGPNNILLWASGATFGLRRTLPHIAGTALGIGAMTLTVAGGFGFVITSLPALAIAMKLAGSAYLLVLAVRIAKAGSTHARTVSRPLGVWQAILFQAVNPKGWIFVLGAVTTFRPAALPAFTGSALIAMIMMVVILPCAAAWAAAGGALSRLLSGERAGRIVAVTLAILVVASVALVWL
jgi:threonine/homoserine/homoserine lactone efflux protein